MSVSRLNLWSRGGGSHPEAVWTRRQNAVRNNSGVFAKYALPTVANGRVYLATFSDRPTTQRTTWSAGSQKCLAPRALKYSRGETFIGVGLGRVELPTSRLSGSQICPTTPTSCRTDQLVKSFTDNQFMVRRPKPPAGSRRH